MARPVKNYCDYFSHDNGMRDHRKVKAIRNKFGIAGYGIWCMLLEYLTGIDGNEFEYSDVEFELMSGDFGVSKQEVKDVIDYCISLEMLFNKNGFINSESLDERLKPVYEKRRVSKEKSKKQQRKDGKFDSNKTVDTEVSATETPQSKVNKTKVKDINIREQSFLDEVSKYSNDYPKHIIQNFIEYWTEPNKSNTKMRFELEKTFGFKARLNTFLRNDNSKSTNNQTKQEYVKPVKYDR